MISSCKYAVPDYWDVGEVFERLIEDNYDEKDVIAGIKEVYNAWITEEILNFNSDLSRSWKKEAQNVCSMEYGKVDIKRT